MQAHRTAQAAAPPTGSSPEPAALDAAALWGDLQAWAHGLGFSQIGVSGVDLTQAEAGLQAWLDAGFHGTMDYMARHGLKRARPAELVPGTVSVITAWMDYLPRQQGAKAGAAVEPAADWREAEAVRLATPGAAVVSIYARGRDYHKVLRGRLQALADRLATQVGSFGHRVFCDSAPVLEAELATRSGLGWRGKHSLVLSRERGSMGFLGEIFVDLALPATPASSAHCGSCSACIEACPTQAIVAPHRVDARRCISYLTIESDAPIPEDLRPAMGARIYGCDDCQRVCPWNRHAQRSGLPDFDVRSVFEAPRLLDLWAWSAADFLRHTEGSAIRRIGYARWRRNLAVALGNALLVMGDGAIGQALEAAAEALAHGQGAGVDGLDAGGRALVAEHVAWALAQRSEAGAAAPSGTAD